jgi:hypothetical protein
LIALKKSPHYQGIDLKADCPSRNAGGPGHVVDRSIKVS